MAGKISELAIAAALADADQTEVLQGGVNVRASLLAQWNYLVSKFGTGDQLLLTASERAEIAANTLKSSYPSGDAAKVGNLTVSGPVDLDALNTRVNALDAAITLEGVFDASSGAFPGGGTAQKGYSYIVSVAGTVDGVAFAVDDRIIALVDNASTTTFAPNWHKADYSDMVQLVAGLSGTITASALITALAVVETGVLSSTSNGEGAALVGIEDVAGNFTGATVEAALAELQTAIDAVAAASDAGTTHLTGYTATALTALTPVLLQGVNGANPVIVPADADVAASMPAVGVLPANIGVTSTGLVVLAGPIVNVDTSAWVAGDALYVSDAGALDNAMPSVGQVLEVARVVYSHATAGIIVVAPKMAGYNSERLTKTGTNVAPDVLALTDNFRHLRNTAANGGAEIPLQASVTWPANSEMRISFTGASGGVVSMPAGGTLNGVAGPCSATFGAFSSGIVERVASDVWEVYGFDAAVS